MIAELASNPILALVVIQLVELRTSLHRLNKKAGIVFGGCPQARHILSRSALPLVALGLWVMLSGCVEIRTRVEMEDPLDPSGAGMHIDASFMLETDETGKLSPKVKATLERLNRNLAQEPEELPFPAWQNQAHTTARAPMTTLSGQPHG